MTQEEQKLEQSPESLDSSERARAKLEEVVKEGRDKLIERLKEFKNIAESHLRGQV